MVSNLRPEPFDEQLHPFAVHHRPAILKILLQLQQSGHCINLFSRTGEQLITSASIHSINADEICLRVPDAAALTVLSKANDAWTVVGPLETLKIQFPLAVSRPTASDGLVRFALPDTLYRIQRREGFRVTPMTTEPVTCVIRNGAHDELYLPVLDLSAVGVAVLWPALELEKLKPGHQWPHSRIEFGLRVAVPCALVVRQISAPMPDFGGAVRVGLAYHQLASEAERMLQIGVMDIERKQRTLRLAEESTKLPESDRHVHNVSVG